MSLNRQLRRLSATIRTSQPGATARTQVMKPAAGDGDLVSPKTLDGQPVLRIIFAPFFSLLVERRRHRLLLLRVAAK